MEKTIATPDAKADLQATLPGFPPGEENIGRSMRSRAPVERDRARQACAPMGALLSVAVTIDAHQRRRTWYVVDPDPALAHNYAAHGFDISGGSKVLIDAEAMRPVALIDVDPPTSRSDAPIPLGFNPYWDLPPT